MHHSAYCAWVVHIAPSWCTSTPYTVVVVYNVPWVHPDRQTESDAYEPTVQCAQVGSYIASQWGRVHLKSFLGLGDGAVRWRIPTRGYLACWKEKNKIMSLTHQKRAARVSTPEKILLYNLRLERQQSIFLYYTVTVSYQKRGWHRAASWSSMPWLTWLISSTHLNGQLVSSCSAIMYSIVATLLSPPLWWCAVSSLSGSLSRYFTRILTP